MELYIIASERKQGFRRGRWPGQRKPMLRRDPGSFLAPVVHVGGAAGVRIDELHLDPFSPALFRWYRLTAGNGPERTRREALAGGGPGG